MSKNIKAGDIIEAKISKLGYCGEGIHKANGIVLFIPRALPDDVVRVKISKLKKKYGSAEIIDIIKPSPARVAPKCRAYEAGCGGCQWLNFDYSSQLYWKTRITRESLKHIGSISAEVKDIIPMSNPYLYRNKLSCRYDAAKRLGLNKENTHEIVEIDECRQELPSNMEIYKALRNTNIPNSITQVHIRSNDKGEAGLYFFVKRKDSGVEKLAFYLQKRIKGLTGVGVSIYNKYVQLSGVPYISQKVGGIIYQIPVNGFFQTNYIQSEKMLELVRDAMRPDCNDTVLDLYCGVGFFALDIAGSVKYVYGVENNLASINYAKENAKLNKIKNVAFIAKDVNKSLSGFKKGSITSVILDPPRTGCEKEVIEELVRIRPKKIVYVSCAPDTLARDLSLLLASGYKVKSCLPLDMFPQTYHIENVVCLEE